MLRLGGDSPTVDRLWLIAWGLFSSAWCVGSAIQLGATFDEPFYVAGGLDRWQTGRHTALLRMGTMPLPADLQTFPLYAWELWRGVRVDPGCGLGPILPVARAGTLVFWWVLLCYGRLAGRQIAGPWGGRLAVAVLACEPCLLAHASLATADLAVTASLLALTYHFSAARESNAIHRRATAGLWFAAALLCKASALVYGPLCLVAVEWDRSRGTRTGPTAGFPAPGVSARAKAFLLDALWIGTIGVTLTVVYCGSDGRPHEPFVRWVNQFPESRLRECMLAAADHCRFFGNAGTALLRQIRHNQQGHGGAYLLGREYPDGIWYYFPVALTIKLTLPLLCTTLILLALGRLRSLQNWATAGAAALFASTLMCRVQIGVRLGLPLVGLLAVGVAAALARELTQSHPGWRRNLFTGGIAGGLAWAVVSDLRVWPHGLCYTNEVWGGTRQGYVCLSDSNYDWGQGLNELACWHRDHGTPPLAVWYFGTDPLLHRLPVRQLRLHALPLTEPADVLPHVRGLYLAVSTTLLRGVPLTAAHRQAQAFLQTHRPAARTMTFLIYDFREPTSPEPIEPQTNSPRNPVTE